MDYVDIEALERRRLHALVTVDMSVADLHADDYQLITPAGAALSKEDYFGRIADGRLSYRRFEPRTAIIVRRYAEAAIVRYQCDIDVLVEGEEFSVIAWHTDIYESRATGWQVVWSQATAYQN